MGRDSGPRPLAHRARRPAAPSGPRPPLWPRAHPQSSHRASKSAAACLLSVSRRTRWGEKVSYGDRRLRIVAGDVLEGVLWFEGEQRDEAGPEREDKEDRSSEFTERGDRGDFSFNPSGTGVTPTAGLDKMQR
jgi:hypothetical protein